MANANKPNLGKKPPKKGLIQRGIEYFLPDYNTNRSGSVEIIDSVDITDLEDRGKPRPKKEG